MGQQRREPHAARGKIARRALSDYRARTWATREKLWIDRVCSAWLIRRFIDQKAKFRWLKDVNDCPKSAVGFDFDGGRLDISTHPFCGGVPEDVRMTTRFRDDEFLGSLMGTVHETGHGRYEQNLPRELLGQPVAEARSMAIHESQSLAFEMQLGRHPGFIARLAPMIGQAFGDRVLVVYQDNRDGNQGYELYARMVDDKLAPLTSEERITFAPKDSVYPIASFGPDGNVGVLFRDYDTQSLEQQVFFTHLGCVAGTN